MKQKLTHLTCYWWMSVRFEFKHILGSSCLLEHETNCTVIAQYWFVPGTYSSMTYIDRITFITNFNKLVHV